MSPINNIDYVMLMIPLEFELGTRSRHLRFDQTGSRFTEHSQPFPKEALVFTCLQYKLYENTNEQFLLFPIVFSTL